MFLNKCCWDCENVCKLFFFYVVSVAYGQMFVMVAILSKFSQYFWCRDIRVCTCGKNRYETGDFDKNRYKFYMKFILLIDTWHIIFIFLNDCSWYELSEYIWCSYCWITLNALFFSLKHSHFTINKEGQNNGSTWPLRAKSLKQKNTIFSHLSANFYLFEWKSTS